MDFDSKAIALQIKLRLHEARLSVDDIAKGTLLKRGTVLNLLNGTNQSTIGRQRVSDFAGIELWPGIKPRGGTSSKSERALAEDALAKIESILLLRKGASDEASRGLCEESVRQILNDPPVTAALVRVSEGAAGVALMHRLMAALLPFFRAVARTEPGQAADESEPITIKIRRAEIPSPVVRPDMAPGSEHSTAEPAKSGRATG